MSSIVTFYSFKGGVGRSMALANVAYELAKKAMKVLIVDWDLEAPGLEKYFSNFKINSSSEGLLQLLLEFQKDRQPNYRDFLSSIHINPEASIDLLQSGRDNEPNKYSFDLQTFDWADFFKLNKGGIHLEMLRKQWLNDYDIILIDSRTGLSDSSGICTIMMPDILIPMFTANYQSLFGIRDTVKYIQNARQKLDIDRMGLTILPIPCRFGTRVEFKESQEWLSRISDILKDCYSDWLPKWIEPKFILEQIKIPQVDYFSFGEKLAVHEQGTIDPESMGYIYARIASLLSTDFTDIPSFIGIDYYNKAKEEYERIQDEQKKDSESKFTNDIFISYPRESYQWVKDLLMPALIEYLTDELGYSPKIFIDFTEIISGEPINESINLAASQSKVLLHVISANDYTNSLSTSISYTFIKREKSTGIPLIFPLQHTLIENLPEIYKSKQIYDFSIFNLEETIKSTKLRVNFAQEIEKLAINIASSLSAKKVKKKADNTDSIRIEQLVALAAEYENIRREMNSSAARTKKMSDIVLKMRDLVNDSTNMLEQFAQSEIAGERLIAIVMLQKFPKVNYLDWLSEHVGNVEKPFIGYQSCVAIYLAARIFGKTQAPLLNEILKKSIKNINKYDFKDQNQIDVLESIKNVLDIKK